MGSPRSGPDLGKRAVSAPGSTCGEHRIVADVAQVIGDPIDGLMRRGAELLGRHGHHATFVELAAVGQTP